jgi:hypothetical protein
MTCRNKKFEANKLKECGRSDLLKESEFEVDYRREKECAEGAIFSLQPRAPIFSFENRAAKNYRNYGQ